MSAKELPGHDYSSGEYLFYYFQIFGCAPFNCDIISMDNSFGERWFFKPSRNGVVYNIFLIFIIVISCSFHIRMSILNKDRSQFEMIYEVIQDIVNNFTAVFILVTFCVQQERFIYIANQISAARESLTRMSGKLLFKKYSVSNGILRIFLTIFAVICLIMIVTPKSPTFTIMLLNISYYPRVFAFIALMLQYTAILKFIKQHFDLMNVNLLQIGEKKYALGSEPISINTLKVQIHKVMQLRRLYASLSDVSQDLSRFYCWPIFWCILSAFLTLIFHLYLTVSGIVSGESDLTTDFNILHFLCELLVIALLVNLTRSATAAVIAVRLFKRYTFSTMFYS